MTDPFDAEHRDNVPAYLVHQRALAEAEVCNPAHSVLEWRAIRDAAAGYPAEVSFDARTGRLQLPIGFEEWNRVRQHPCWPEYREQMQSLPAGEAIGFGTWLAGGGVGRSDAATRARPSRPFLCDPYTELPAGWVRGDPASTQPDHPYRQIAYDPARHLVVRSVDAPSPVTLDRLATAGFEPLTARDDADVTYFVRDRTIDRQPVLQPAAASRGRTP